VRVLLVSLLAVSALAAPVQDGPANPVVHRWIEAARTHRPGEVDRALLDVAEMPAATLRAVFRELEKALRQELQGSPEGRNEVRQRGALLHSDLALLLPERAATLQFKDIDVTLGRAAQDGVGRAPVRAPLDGLVYSVDGEYAASRTESGHWPFASWLLAGVKPDPASDEFVRLWYRAVAAGFLDRHLFGNAAFHMRRARTVLPRDPVLLFYGGAMHEALASPRVQNVQHGTRPGGVENIVMGQMVSKPDTGLPSERDELQQAERGLREALKYDAPVEAKVRLGRVTGRLGRHAEAASLLEQVTPPAGDVRLRYFRELFLGTELAAVGRTGDARRAFERAATLCPGAQSPLVALGDVGRRSGDRAAALAALRRIEALPADEPERVDPWWDYYRSYAADAGRQLAAVRRWFDVKRRP
jgi:hypothetical protein